MTVGAVESLAEHLVADTPEAVLDDLTLSFRREARADGEPMREYDGQWVGRLRRIGSAKLRHWGFPELIDNAALLISELVTNALRHGKSNKVAFRFLLAAHVLVIEVDDGTPRRAHVQQAGPEDENGRGMLIVTAVAEEWGVSLDGTKTWCTLTIPAPQRKNR